MTSAIGSVPPMTDLAARLYRSLRDLVVRTETELEEQNALRARNFLPARRCSCHSLFAGPGCKPCLVKRARKVMAEYDRAHYATKCICDGWPGGFEGFREDCPEHGRETPIPCSECGKVTGDDIVIQFDMFDHATAQCRACYAAMRERELAEVEA